MTLRWKECELTGEVQCIGLLLVTTSEGLKLVGTQIWCPLKKEKGKSGRADLLFVGVMDRNCPVLILCFRREITRSDLIQKAKSIFLQVLMVLKILSRCLTSGKGREGAKKKQEGREGSKQQHKSWG
jgi:hypothetical protein